MKKVFSALLFISVFSIGIFAQTKHRFVLHPARGESGKAVAGRIKNSLKGETYIDYFFTVPKGKSADISVDTDSGEEVRFDLISPTGKKIYEDTKDILDELPTKGTYTVRVYRKKDTDDKIGVSKFQLAIFMYI